MTGLNKMAWVGLIPGIVLAHLESIFLSYGFALNFAPEFSFFG
jgi:hypothetical protein